jgi:hypothetical protein
MACNSPLRAYRDVNGEIVFHDRRADTELALPCGQCMGCKIEKSKQWAVRIMHESQMHEDNCVVTFTFEQTSETLNYDPLQAFTKRARKKHPEIRYFHAGEYGETYSRPHYHSIIFGQGFRDRTYLKKTKRGSIQYTSKELTTIWEGGRGWNEKLKAGTASVSDLNYDAATYIAGYITKKLNGNGSTKYLDIYDPETGEIIERQKEHAHMSLKPAIGLTWLQKNWREVSNGTTVMNGTEILIPKYYRDWFNDDKKTKGIVPEKELQQIRINIEEQLLTKIKEESQTWQRREAREKIQRSRNKIYTRDIEGTS